MPPRIVTRHVLTALGVAALMAASTLTASADTLISTNGQVGANHLKDTAGHPGARCWYVEGAGSGEEVLDWIRVKPPVVFARNSTAARDRQTIRFRAIIQRRDAGAGSWVEDQSSSLTAFAWDDQKASFPAIDLHVDSNYGSKFRARVEITWYSKPGGVWVQNGQVVREVDWYHKVFLSTVYGNDVENLPDYCKDYDLNN
jgi:hypothetical protein